MRTFLLAATVALVASAACSSSTAGTSGTIAAQRGGPVIAPGVEASCAAPFLATKPWPTHQLQRHTDDFGAVAAGQRLVVHGYMYAAGPCQDTGPGSFQPQQPKDRVVLRLTTSDHRTRVIAIGRPNGNLFSFATTFRVPRDAAPGPAVVSDGERHTVTLTIADR